MEKNYWEDFYEKQGATNSPSDFAYFCAEIYNIKTDGTLFDIGCGNGRDAIYFSTKEISTIGIEQSDIAVKDNILKAASANKLIKFDRGDFTNYNYNQNINEFSLYSRFTLHAISYDEEKIFLKHIINFKGLKKLFIEARTINDDLYGKGKKVGKHEFVTSHYRRFIDPDILKKQLVPFFEIEYFRESRGFSKTINDDPVLLRMVCKRI